MKRVDDKKISDVMTVKVITAREDMTIKELKWLFDKHDFNAFPVVKGTRVVGIVTKMDLFKTFSMGRKATLRDMYNLWATRVDEIM
ncbi:MAG TPA: CBS domain-containing protein, partial [Methanomassiliicoccales archaeon]|nr:CBS domain-containing protein [Methanomassiliicoccales archaeon]